MSQVWQAERGVRVRPRVSAPGGAHHDAEDRGGLRRSVLLYYYHTRPGLLVSWFMFHCCCYFQLSIAKSVLFPNILRLGMWGFGLWIGTWIWDFVLGLRLGLDNSSIFQVRWTRHSGQGGSLWPDSMDNARWDKRCLPLWTDKLMLRCTWASFRTQPSLTRCHAYKQISTTPRSSSTTPSRPSFRGVRSWTTSWTRAKLCPCSPRLSTRRPGRPTVAVAPPGDKLSECSSCNYDYWCYLSLFINYYWIYY